MKILFDVNNVKNNVIVEHNNQKIIFKFPSIKINNVLDLNSDKTGVFYYLNNFFSTLTASEANEVFNIYVSIEECINSKLDIKHIDNNLKVLIERLFNIINYDKILYYVNYNSNIYPPHNFDTVYKEDREKNTSVEKTYLKHEYLELAALAIAAKSMLPVWGEYLKIFNKHTYKEMYALRLLPESINKTVAMLKLSVYISNIDKYKYNTDNVLILGINNEDRELYLLSKVIIRRLPVGEILPVKEGCLITNIHNYVMRKTDNDTDTGGRMLQSRASIKKDEPTVSLGDDDSSNAFERIRRISSTSPSSIEIEVSLNDPYFIFESIYGKKNDEVLNEFLHNCKKIYIPIERPCMTLVKWVLKPILNSKGFNYISDLNVLRNCIAITGAYLYLNGFYWLSAMVTSTRIDREAEEINTNNINAINGKCRSDSRLNELNDISSVMVLKNKKYVSVLYEHAMLLTDDIQSLDLLLTCGKEHKKLINNTGSKLYMVSDINLMIIDLMIHLNKTQKIELIKR